MSFAIESQRRFSSFGSSSSLGSLLSVGPSSSLALAFIFGFGFRCFGGMVLQVDVASRNHNGI